MKDNSPVFFGTSLKCLVQKGLSKLNFADFWVVGRKSTKFLMSYLKQQVSFFKLCITFSVLRDNSSVLFSWNFTWFGQKEPIKVKNVRLSTAHLKFHQICTLIGSFCWKYTKFQLKKYFALWLVPFVQNI